jgi:hypothetical protein
MSPSIPFGLQLYMAGWLTALAVSVGLVVRRRPGCTLLQSAYWRFLFEPWKAAAFLAATLIITLAAPYSGDPTWDVPDSLIISAAVYLLAPWCVAVIARGLRQRTFDWQTAVAVCFFFVPCWIYDGYILGRDGYYPATWSSNLVLSGGITFIAGLFWNLFWTPRTGLTFAFLSDPWPPAERTPLRKVLWPCMLLAVPVAASVGWFVVMYFYP